jgi:hypothetical protein
MEEIVESWALGVKGTFFSSSAAAVQVTNRSLIIPQAGDMLAEFSGYSTIGVAHKSI